MRSYFAPVRRKYGRFCTGVIVAALLAMSVTAATASANTFTGKLPGKTWTTDGNVITLHWIVAEVTSGPGAICVGPVQHSGGGWVFPYGWNCGNLVVSWEFPALAAAAGVDNPNSGEDKFGAVYG